MAKHWNRGVQERGYKEQHQKSPGHHLNTYQKMQLAHQKGRLNQLCNRWMSKWVNSRTDKERTKHCQCDTCHLLNIWDIYWWVQTPCFTRPSFSGAALVLPSLLAHMSGHRQVCFFIATFESFWRLLTTGNTKRDSAPIHVRSRSNTSILGKVSVANMTREKLLFYR